MRDYDKLFWYCARRYDRSHVAAWCALAVRAYNLAACVRHIGQEAHHEHVRGLSTRQYLD